MKGETFEKKFGEQAATRREDRVTSREMGRFC
jgi:hypothetical protein